MDTKGTVSFDWGFGYPTMMLVPPQFKTAHVARQQTAWSITVATCSSAECLY